MFVECLEERRLCFASVPTGYVKLDTVQIRPAAGTYASDLTLTAGTTFFLRATGVTRTSGNAYHGDAAFIASTATTTTTTTTTTSWGISTIVGDTTLATTAWGAAESDHVYGQRITSKTSGALSFSFANDSLDKISTLAVTIYGPVPGVRVATIHDDDVTGSSLVKQLSSKQVDLPLDNADWDHNGVADDKQSGAVAGDEFLLPITLPAIAGATSKSHITIEAPKGLRVWLNPDRTGSTVGVGLRATKARTVYVEATAEAANHAIENLAIELPIAGISVEQDLPISVFSMAGPLTATGGSNLVYSSDSATGEWSSATGGTLDTSTIHTVHEVAYANVLWNNSAQIGFANFEADADYLWGLPVEVTV